MPYIDGPIQLWPSTVMPYIDGPIQLWPCIGMALVDRALGLAVSAGPVQLLPHGYGRISLRPTGDGSLRQYREFMPLRKGWSTGRSSSRSSYAGRSYTVMTLYKLWSYIVMALLDRAPAGPI